MEQLLYKLVICDNELSYEGYNKEFCIGIFSSFNRAEETAKFYLNNVEGFKDYDCSYNIIEKKVTGENLCNEVYMVYGWNENQNLDETDIIESACFTKENMAKQHMVKLQEIYYRKEWCVSRFFIDELLCKDGFVRV